MDEYINYVKYVKKDSYNYKETDIEYLDNVECKLIIIWDKKIYYIILYKDVFFKK